jgi:hypothetical protein
MIRRISESFDHSTYSRNTNLREELLAVEDGTPSTYVRQRHTGGQATRATQMKKVHSKKQKDCRR